MKNALKSVLCIYGESVSLKMQFVFSMPEQLLDGE